MSSYVDVVCVGKSDETETETENYQKNVDNLINKEQERKETLLDYIYENSSYLADVVEDIKQRWDSFGFVTRLQCTDIARILEETMIVTVTEIEEESEDEYDFEDTIANTVPEKNIFL